MITIIIYDSISFIKLVHFFGLVLVAIIISVLAGYMNQRYRVFMTPTYEMKARIKISHVVVDVLLALLSGFGIGIAILNKDIVSRVGFAIILSITPPIINKPPNHSVIDITSPITIIAKIAANKGSVLKMIAVFDGLIIFCAQTIIPIPKSVAKIPVVLKLI